ncbi:uncharacterized protein LOC129185734 isoform X2 [Dunckerocampus dactyliophorus]|uniref:uncharacterized protein LOC129185734 isoform X2 n=1 Tax=Dunckerocampus dactyliophorus TaxID=161453 RepID=UPI00240514EE|nr:uncharacterized protein LOC129185734 isoform X2 [Dunckerocampus dactyliophorus]
MFSLQCQTQSHHQKMNKMRRRNPKRIFLRSSSTVSLHQRFSHVLLEQMMLPKVACAPPPVVFVVNSEPSSSLGLQVPPPRRSSVWTRLGWRRAGFWTFRSKYGWRARFRRVALRRAGGSKLTQQLGPRCRLLRTKGFKKRSQEQEHLPLRRGGFTRERGLKAPTKKELDAQLDEYMSKSKSRLDAQLDEYMSKSKSRLDADLDEYMALAGTQLHLD